jgi:uncharacterized protein YlxW (UPF0749 family)
VRDFYICQAARERDVLQERVEKLQDEVKRLTAERDQVQRWGRATLDELERVRRGGA